MSLKLTGNVQSACDFLYSTLIETMRLSCKVAFSSYSELFVKVADFNLLHLHLTPPLEVTPFKFRGDLWRQKSRVPRLSRGVVCVILCLAILIQYRRVTDTHTHTHTRTHARLAWRAPARHARRRHIPRQHSVTR